ncbi:MAG: ZIP family metal transporter [Methanomassiliicoccaceae archaeon]|jgi:zinc transporter ZupT|nr:ZIP family metal transporter [Methanomassiliicoccaceae archaeon]
MFEDVDPYLILLLFVAVILAVSLAGAFVPRIMKLNMRQAHLLVALSAGIILGILFFVLLPETFEAAHEEGAGDMDAVFLMAGGFRVIVLIDVIMKRKYTCSCTDCIDKDHIHEVTSFTAFAGLAVHAAVDGILLSIALIAGGEVAVAMIIAIALHKFADVFALSSIFALTKIEKRKTLIYMIVFILITPIAAIVSMPIMDAVGDLNEFIPLAFATGILMYVGIYTLLPEAFHERRDTLISFVLVVIGIIAIAAIALTLGH